MALRISGNLKLNAGQGYSLEDLSGPRNPHGHDLEEFRETRNRMQVKVMALMV